MDASVINEIFPQLIPQLATEAGIPDERVISLFEALGSDNSFEFIPDPAGARISGGHPDWFTDGCHPNDLGYNVIAETVFRKIAASLEKAAGRSTMVQTEDGEGFCSACTVL